MERVIESRAVRCESGGVGVAWSELRLEQCGFSSFQAGWCIF